MIILTSSDVMQRGQKVYGFQYVLMCTTMNGLMRSLSLESVRTMHFLIMNSHFNDGCLIMFRPATEHLFLAGKAVKHTTSGTPAPFLVLKQIK